jgi:hypothetical protein
MATLTSITIKGKSIPLGNHRLSGLLLSQPVTKEKIMAEGFGRVRPGDLISSDLMNRIIAQVEETQAKLASIDHLLPGPQKVAVPNLFSLSLGIAKTELTKPKFGLLPGDIFDTSGQRIFPENSAALELVVLGQSPEANRIIPIGSKVNLVIAHAATGGSGGGGAPTSNHEVTGIEPATSARADQEVTVIGANFITPYYRNRVIFDGEFFATPKLGSSVTRLVVDVPADIPNLPRDVQIAVEANGVTRLLPTLFLIRPKSTTPELKITHWEPQIRVAVGDSLQIFGTGFSEIADQNKITFIYMPNPDLKLGVSGIGVRRVGNEMRVDINVPTFPANMAPADTGTQYRVTLHIGENQSVVASGMIIEIDPPSI